MNEKLLQFIWQFQYFNQSFLSLTDGNTIKVIRPGELNTNQGPDFIAGEIIINNTRWVGNIELHINTSDWYKHKHNTDNRYESIILHVVWNDDVPVKDALGNQLPTLVLQDKVANILLDRYKILMNEQILLPCASWLNTIDDLVWTSWKERLVVERLTKRAEQIFVKLKLFKGDWERVCWIQIGRVFGGKVNANSFEFIIQSIPIVVLKRHRLDILQIEALLMGQAGFLNKDLKESYALTLQKEYMFLKNKYSLSPLQLQPQFLRMRPASFPTIRFAQLAVFFQKHPQLMQHIKSIKSVKIFHQLFCITASDYWDTHYRLDKESKFQKKEIGKQLKNNLLINAIIPLLFAYGLYNQNSLYQELAIELLYQLPVEKNQVLKIWESLPVKQNTAFDTQALLELLQFYCNKKACLNCTIGNGILKKGV
jgi:hypothetical protein